MCHRLYLSFFLCLFLPAFSLAQQVLESDARERAKEFLQRGWSHGAPRRGAAATTALDAADIVLAYTSTCDDDTHYYIYNDVVDGGFVIVGGDERAVPILGFCDHGSFDYASAPENLKSWLSQYDAQIAAMKTDGEGLSASASRMSSERGLKQHHEDIPDLIVAPWSQSSPNNLLCPIDEASGNHCVVGCVATASTIVMRYYQWPNAALGHTYNWENILLDYSSVDYTEEQAMAVAQLSVDCAESLHMNFGEKLSDASTSDVPGVLASIFGYNRGMTLEDRYYYTDEEWDALLYSELAAGRPLYYRAHDAKGQGGHGFNCVGYSSYLDMYSFNWGWGGYGNGYYALSAAPGLQVDSFDFSLCHTIIANCKPDYTGDSKPAIIVRKSPNKAFILSVGSSEATLQVTMNNIGLGEGKVLLGIMASDETTGMSVFTSGSEETIKPSYQSFSLKLPLDILPHNGTFILRPVYRIDEAEGEGDWHVVDLPIADELPKLVVIDKEAPTTVKVSFRLPENTLELNQRMQIVHNSTYEGEISYTVSDDAIAEVSAEGVITPKALGTVSIQIHAVANGEFLETDVTLSLEIVPVSRLTKVTLSNNAIHIGETAQISIEKKNHTGSVRFSSADPAVAQVSEAGLVTGFAVGQTTIEVQICGSANECQELSRFDVIVLPAELIIEEGTYGFAEMPTLPYDNHPTSENLQLNYSIKNKTGETLEKATIWYELLHGESLLKKGYFGFNNLKPDIIAKASTNGWGPMKSIVDQMVVGETYELRFYTDEACSIPANIPSMTYVWCEEQEYLLTIPACGWTAVCLPCDATLPEGVQSYACTTYGRGVVQLKPKPNLKRWVPCVICGEAGNYSLSAPVMTDVQCHTSGLLSDYTQGEVSSTAHYYRLMKREGVVAFYALTAEDGEIAVDEVVLRLPDGLADYPKLILIENLVQGQTPGDADGNGAIEQADLQLLLEYLLELPVESGTYFFPTDADVDANGAITLSDLTSIIEKLKK